MTTLDSTIRRATRERYMTAHLRVLSLWQPWASLCVTPDPEHEGAPAKVHETRDWAPRIALPIAVAIHATKTVHKEARYAFAAPEFRAALKRCGFYPDDPTLLLAGKMQSPLRPVPLGAIVGLATVVTVHRMIETHAAQEDDRVFGSWSPGRFAWRLASTVMLPEPIRFIGRQDALYDLDLATRERINAQLHAMMARDE
ncbi:MAG: hypothetical protein ACHQWU_15520 [Gemmatimonadales bacterium]